MNLFKELVKKYGVGLVLGAATLDGYRRQYINDKRQDILDKINTERNTNSEEVKKEYDKLIDELSQNTQNKASIGRYKDAADEHQKAVERFQADPSAYNEHEKNKSFNKLNESYEEIKKLDISDYLSSLYTKYSEYLDTLSADKIVCIFNIIIDGLILSSFLSVLTIMLSENIINKIGFLEKYPRILQLLKLRNYVNKKVSKIYLLIHLIIIILGILGNIYMYFI